MLYDFHRKFSRQVSLVGRYFLLWDMELLGCKIEEVFIHLTIRIHRFALSPYLFQSIFFFNPSPPSPFIRCTRRTPWWNSRKYLSRRNEERRRKEGARPCARITMLFPHLHITFISGNIVNHVARCKMSLLIELDAVPAVCRILV